MINKEKRCEVAAKLRNVEIEDLTSFGHGYSAHLGEAIGQCVRLVSGHECLVEYGLNTLADLIEPKERTCYIVKWFEATTRSEFGRERVELSCGHIAERHSKFCPSCGAKVVKKNDF
jgi:hypothetical protein